MKVGGSPTHSRYLLVTQCLDWIDSRGLPRRVDSEHYPDENRYAEGDHNGSGCDDRLPLGGLCDDPRDQETEADPENASCDRDHRRFREELTKNIVPLRADGAAYANLARSFHHGRQH